AISQVSLRNPVRPGLVENAAGARRATLSPLVGPRAPASPPRPSRAGVGQPFTVRRQGFTIRRMRVAVADDAVILREGLARLLDEAGFEVVGLAANASELFEIVERERPDVAIVDIRMPPRHTDEGLQAAKTIRARWPGTGILVL